MTTEAPQSNQQPMAPDCYYCGKAATHDVKAPTAARVPGCIGLTHWRPVCDACSPPEPHGA